MKTLAVVLLSVLALGCDSKKDEPAKGDAKAEAKEKPAPYTGELSVARIMDESKSVKPKPFDKWEDALPALESKLGKAVKVDGNDYSWAIVDGETCAYLTVEKDGDAVGVVDGPGKIDKMMKSMFDKCAAKAGVEVPAEDEAAGSGGSGGEAPAEGGSGGEAAAEGGSGGEAPADGSGG